MRAVRHAWCAIAAAFLVSACAHNTRTRPEKGEPAAIDEELYAAAVRGTLQHFGRDDREPTLYCVTLPGGTSLPFLARFTHEPFLVAGPDSCKWDGGAVVPASSSAEIVSDGRPTGARVTPTRATFLHVEEVRWVSPTRAQADTSIVYGNLGANGLTLTLERQDGQWKVVNAEDTWIS
ncbi:hypothetical protein ATI61_106143 [Archangium gephyra]|uniref:Lipoprotein n=1 Tax=Archangium gephyra TaxID=48 RepID=A0AAC8TAB0_9BACT|nr:hypothetical protein [Archangium gephyra]AKI98754.1 Hypothetical protein AA314_00381 [Archangium gephyra]REG30674.1 hypothetical protein ATI61_106143 [Archangium gephyra]